MLWLYFTTEDVTLQPCRNSASLTKFCETPFIYTYLRAVTKEKQGKNFVKTLQKTGIPVVQVAQLENTSSKQMVLFFVFYPDYKYPKPF